MMTVSGFVGVVSRAFLSEQTTSGLFSKKDGPATVCSGLASQTFWVLFINP
jgi:hypothetical protein